MIDVINSVFIKHDSSFKSLTKIALSQIILKIIYENKSRGAMIKTIKSKIENYIGVPFNYRDIEFALDHLRNENKVNKKSNKYFILESYKSELDSCVRESEILHKDVINYWFSKCETYISENGENKIYKWFNKLMVNFFKEYRYDWINDLKNRRFTGKRSTLNIEKILTNCFEKVKIEDQDKEWLKKQFSNFLNNANQ